MTNIQIDKESERIAQFMMKHFPEPVWMATFIDRGVILFSFN